MGLHMQLVDSYVDVTLPQYSCHLLLLKLCCGLLQGFVYLKFMSGDGASKAQSALNGRWFAGRQIAADFQFPAVYNNYFRL